MGGFILTKFVSNADGITSVRKFEDCETASSPITEICNGAEQSSYIFGLKWDHVKYTLVVSRGVDRRLDKAITQRSVLSFVSSVFDPVGLVAPYTVEARPLPKDQGPTLGRRIAGRHIDKFLEWHSGLALLGQLTIPRCYFTEQVDQIELDMFCDSSQDVFCEVGFLRARLSKSHKTQTSFIYNKVHVMPMKALSIPKLEL